METKANGLRAGEIVNGVETKYTLHGLLIMHRTVGDDMIQFFCDAQLYPVKVNYNGAVYDFSHNLRGGITEMVDETNAMVVKSNIMFEMCKLVRRVL